MLERFGEESCRRDESGHLAPDGDDDAAYLREEMRSISVCSKEYMSG